VSVHPTISLLSHSGGGRQQRFRPGLSPPTAYKYFFISPSQHCTAAL